MSLFPSGVSSEKSEDSKKTNKDWLENKSFHTSAAILVQNNLKNEIDKSLSGTNSFDQVNLEKNDDFVSDVDFVSSSDNDEILSEPPDKLQVIEIQVDKEPNKDNLYFQRLYKVKVPKYYRSTYACLGLSSHFQIIFDKKRKQKRKRKDPLSSRYYQIDKDVLNTIQNEDETEKYKTQIENLNVETRKNPTNVDAWLQLISLQDELPGKNVRLKTEKQVSILDKAIASNPREYKLKLKRLELLESIAEDSDRDWKNLVFHHPDSKESWEAYINHTLISSRFTVSRTSKVFEKCLETLSSIRKQSHRSEEFPQAMEACMLDMLKKLVQFLVEAGHTERVVTLLLLMLELNVRSQSNKDLNDARYFYESGIPLLGQAESKGWDQWHAKFERGGWSDASLTKTVSCEENYDDLIDFDLSVSENWLMLECERGRSNLLSFQSEDELEDLGRKVTFDDIKGFLFLVDDDQNRIKILEIFLQFLGVVPENEFASSNLLVSQPCQLTHALQHSDVPGDIGSLQKVTCLNCPRCRVIPRSPHHDLLQLVFEQLAPSNLGRIRREVAACCVGYYVVRMSALSVEPEMKSELKKTYKEARKLAKTFLKQDPGDYLVWAKLARIENSAKKVDECEKIFRNSLCMCKERSEALMLTRSYSQLILKQDQDSVKRVLAAFGDDLKFSTYFQNNKDPSAAVLLRANRSLERLCEDLGCLYEQVEMNSTREPSSFANSLFCFLLLGIITSSRVTPDVFRKYLRILRKAKNNGNKQSFYDLRFIHEFNISLSASDYHRNNAYRRALLSALDDIPDHPPFLIKLCQIEIGCSLTSVMRRYFTLSNPILVFFSVFFELLRSEQIDESHVPPRVLNVLERSLNTHTSNVLLWRIFAKLSKNPEVVLTRASVNCPWSKAIACDRIRFAEEKIDDVLLFMQDKGLRLRTPVEEVRLLLAV